MTKTSAFSQSDDQCLRAAARLRGEQAPVAGDIVIVCGADVPQDYTVSVTPGPPALRFGDYDKALAWARKSATRTCVDVWVVEDRRDATLVVRQRPDAMVGR